MVCQTRFRRHSAARGISGVPASFGALENGTEPASGVTMLPSKLRRLLAIALALAPAIAFAWAAYDHRWMDDDGFINLRIVRNLLAGAGPTFNVDERIEAATSPLWIYVLALFGAFGLRLEYVAVYVGIALAVTGVIFAQRAALRLAAEDGTEGKGVFLPIGVAIVVAVPAAWDYASSGLETGLSLAWLGVSYAALARRLTSSGDVAPRRFAWASEAALFGLGPLIRPEFAIYSAMVLLVLIAATAPRRPRRALGPIAGIVASAAAIPLAYQIFRMGYYAAFTPNTAIAKEAFRSNWTQGVCYFHNFFGTYQLGVPLVAVGALWILLVHKRVETRRRPVILATIALPLGAAIHVAYLVAIGGDYMHARLLLPPLFAALLPVASVRFDLSGPRWRSAVFGTATLVIAAWAVVCVGRLRVGVENVCGIGDEHGWYLRESGEDHPVLLSRYTRHSFYETAKKMLDRIEGQCRSDHDACRSVFLEGWEIEKVVDSTRSTLAIARDVDPRIHAAFSAGAIGITGYLSPPTAHIVDRHGLADPIVARAELEKRGRPGHEKELPAAWWLARFTAPTLDEDSPTAAARHALSCGDLGGFEHAITAPVTPSLFFENMRNAWRYTRLKIPLDPLEGEHRFCGESVNPTTIAGGEGGTAFHWQCPSGRHLTGFHGTFNSKEHAIASVQAICESQERLPLAVRGPLFGEKSDDTFDVACPPGTTVGGAFGTSERWVQSLGMICLRQDRTSFRGSATGAQDVGKAFAVTCPGPEVRGLVGRAGALVDAIGFECSP